MASNKLIIILDAIRNASVILVFIPYALLMVLAIWRFSCRFRYASEVPLRNPLSVLEFTEPKDKRKDRLQERSRRREEKSLPRARLRSLVIARRRLLLSFLIPISGLVIFSFGLALVLV